MVVKKLVSTNQTKLKRAISYLVLSDIHLGHPNNPTTRILDNLTLYFENFSSTSRFKDLDLIFFAGDLWDRLLEMLKSTGVFDFMAWFSKLMMFCVKHDITLCILEGTESHDRQQSELAVVLAGIAKTISNKDIKFRYIDKLSIETFEEFGLDVLFVPDEWSPSGEETLEQVKLLLKEKNIQQVDIAIMHGMFGYQLKDIPGNHPKHDEEAYHEIVRYFINIGHVHTFSTYGRIIAQGSFDRLRHNEEEPKGGVLIHINPNGENRFKFIENKNSMIFKTLEIKQPDLDKALRFIDKEVSKLPRGSYVRIKASKTHPVYQALKEIQLRHLYINFTRKSIEDADEDHQLMQVRIVEDNDAYVSISITKDNIVDLTLKEVYDIGGLESSQMEMLKGLLEQNC